MTTPGVAAAVRPVTSRGLFLTCNASRKPSTSRATTAERWSNSFRPTRNVWAASSSLNPEGGIRRNSRHFSLSAASDSGLRAENVSNCQPASVEGATTTGASSTMAWALVPPTPSELTAARRGSGPRTQGLGLSITKNGVLAMSNRLLGWLKLRLAGINSLRSASATLINEATPAAVSRWPIFVFSEPMPQKF